MAYMLSSVTIPKNLARNDDLVVIPRKEYEELIELRAVKEFVPTTAQKKALIRAEVNLKKGKTLSYNELVKKLGFAS